MVGNNREHGSMGELGTSYTIIMLFFLSLNLILVFFSVLLVLLFIVKFFF